MTGDFIDGSTATGLLIIIIGGSEIHYQFMTREGSKLNVEGAMLGLAGGLYSISIFVVEENGLPFERVATRPRTTSLANSKLSVSYTHLTLPTIYSV